MSKEKPAIFINYRRKLSTLEARLLYLMLNFRFPDEVFLDQENLEAGDIWRSKLKENIESAKVMISLIPEGWATFADGGLKSKLYYDEKCHVRHEIKTALDAGITIIPILVNGAKQPPKEHLPPAIEDLFEKFNNGQPLDFKLSPDVTAYEKLFEQIAAKANLAQSEVDEDNKNLFQRPLAEEFPLPADMFDFMPAADSPFVGLKPFKRDDARLFFGRSREIYNLCHKILYQSSPRLLLLDGYSGTGKSSLLQAGLIPRIEAQGWKVSYRRREEDKINGLKGVFDLLLNDVAHNPISNQLLILDQVEEAVTDRIEGLPNELEEFVLALKDALKVHKNCKFILGFRSEQATRIMKVLIDANLSFDQKNTLYPLERVGAVEAISGVARDTELKEGKYNLEFRPANLPDRIATRLLSGRDNSHIAPLLQVNMELLWERCKQEDGSVLITANDLDNFIDRQEDLLNYYISQIRKKHSSNFASDQKILKILRFYVKDEPASAIRLDDDFNFDKEFKTDTAAPLLLAELKRLYLLSGIISGGRNATRLAHDVMAPIIQERYKKEVEFTIATRSDNYFNELLNKITQQINSLQYTEAQQTLLNLFQLETRREELRPFMFELLFFWSETRRKMEMEQTLSFWLDSNLLSGKLAVEINSLYGKGDKESVRNWLQKADPGKYDDLLKKYYAPIGVVMIEIPGGKPKIGEDLNEHVAKVDTFYLSNVQTTCWKYGLYLFAEGRDKELPKITPSWGLNGDHPVVKVTWYDAIEYCNWLSGNMGLEKVYDINKTMEDPNNRKNINEKKWLVKQDFGANGYRLPTEDEWEFAAHGGGLTKNTKFAGSNNLDEVGWYIENAKGKTQPVGKLKPNELGLFDMSGNVSEWCFNWLHAPKEGLPKDDYDNLRALRGGSHHDTSDSCRVAFESGGYSIELGYDFAGFRLAQGYR